MKRFSINWKRVGLTAGAIFLILLVVDFNARLEVLNKLENQAEIVRAEATQVAATQVALKTKVAYAGSDQMVEDEARGNNRMKQEGDHTVIVIGQEGVPPITEPESAPVPAFPKSNWELWREVFFGK
ncbi:MAG: hypothetical protein Kow002_10820 [Anaerolineales bacterium]